MSPSHPSSINASQSSSSPSQTSVAAGFTVEFVSSQSNGEHARPSPKPSPSSSVSAQTQLMSAPLQSWSIPSSQTSSSSGESPGSRSSQSNCGQPRSSPQPSPSPSDCPQGQESLPVPGVPKSPSSPAIGIELRHHWFIASLVDASGSPDAGSNDRLCPGNQAGTTELSRSTRSISVPKNERTTSSCRSRLNEESSAAATMPPLLPTSRLRANTTRPWAGTCTDAEKTKLSVPSSWSSNPRRSMG